MNCTCICYGFTQCQICPLMTLANEGEISPVYIGIVPWLSLYLNYHFTLYYIATCSIIVLFLSIYIIVLYLFMVLWPWVSLSHNCVWFFTYSLYMYTYICCWNGVCFTVFYIALLLCEYTVINVNPPPWPMIGHTHIYRSIFNVLTLDKEFISQSSETGFFIFSWVRRKTHMEITEAV